MGDLLAEMVLQPDDTQTAALTAYVGRYADATNWLVGRLTQDGGGDQVALHHRYYGELRSRFGLPAQSAVLCLKHGAKLMRSPEGRMPEGRTLPGTGPAPYDRHLFSLRAVDSLSLATLEGRIVVRCALARYAERSVAAGDAELQCEDRRWTFRVKTRLPKGAVATADESKEAKMSDKLLGRIARLVAGVAHSAVAHAEQMAPAAALEQAIREIDDAEREVKAEMGKAEAVRFNLTRRKDQLDEEHAALLVKVETALGEGSEALAEAGVARQIDIENQIVLLDRGLADVEQDIAKLGESVSALQASRREARDRLRDVKAAESAASLPGSGPTGGGRRGVAGKAEDAIAGAQRLAEDLTGVPPDGVRNRKELDDLAELHRKKEIRERLAQIKAKSRDKT